MALVNLDTAVLHIIINTIILGPVLWISGRLLAGKQNAKFSHGLWIAALGTILGEILGFFFSGIIATIIVLIIWLALIKHFFNCGWLKAILIAIVGIIVLIVIAFVLVAIGFVALRQYLPIPSGLPA